MTKQKVAIFDIDGTIFRSGFYREVLFELIKQDKIPLKMKKIYSTKEMDWKIRKSDESFAVFEDKIVEAFHQSLGDMKITDYEQVGRDVVRKKGNFCYKYTVDLIQKLKKEDYCLILISGSQQEMVDEFAKLHGFDLAFGTIYERGNDGTFTGKITREGWHNKEKILQNNLDWEKFTMKNSLAIGDTMGDASLLAVVDNPIAFNPEKKLFQTAKDNNWRIVVERKNVIYELSSKNKEYKLK